MENNDLSQKNTAQSAEEIVTKLRAELAQREQELAEKKHRIQTLEHQLHQALTARFGRKSEQQDSHQLDFLFDEAILTKEQTAIREADESIHVPSHTRKKAGRKPLPADLLRVEVIHDITDGDKTCACGHELSHISNETSEQLEYIPAKVQVIVNVRKKYACKACESTVKTAPLPAQILPKSIATPSLLAHIAISKYDDHLPLYRQEEILQRHHIDIARNTLGDWMIRVGEQMTPLIKLLHHDMMEYDVAFADETPLQVLKQPGKTAKQKSTMWVFNGGAPDKKSVIYHYAATRASEVPLRFFEDYRGYLHADGYAGYLPLITTQRIKLVACFAHIRRKFYAITQSTQTEGLAHQAMKWITELYALEKKLRDENASPEPIKTIRHEKARPIIEQMHAWLQMHSLKSPPKSPMGEAISYTLKQWHHFLHYLDDGRLEIDNNRSERAVKPFVIGRKTWLFAGNHLGAIAGANLLSLIETAKIHELNPYDYLRYLFTHLPHAKTLEQLEALLPYHCKGVLA
ncbi:MAG: IS66 family transposase [Gammaproteobacteria bacterium]|nr:IS66 family transposase [Gammaproteobacteria bacterium]